MIQYLNVFFYDIYPYICATVFFLGSWLRYDYGQYTWRASSSQMLDKRGMVIWSNLFHIGILGIFFGHLFGMLTPHWMYAWFLPVAAKQLMAMVLGGICGVLTLIGGAGLLWRRLTNQRVRATSTTPDIIIMSILLIQCLLGLSTIPFSAQYPDGSEMMKLGGWAQSIVTFRGGSSEMLNGVAFVFRLHLVLGMTIFLLFPFTRLVHVWSAPFEYFTRRYQVVRSSISNCAFAAIISPWPDSPSLSGHLQAMIVLQSQENVNETAGVPRRCFYLTTVSRQFCRCCFPRR